MQNELWIKVDEQVSGPFSPELVRQMAANGEITPDHLVSADRGEWVRASSFKGLDLSNAIASHHDSNRQADACDRGGELHPAEQDRSDDPDGQKSSRRFCPNCGGRVLRGARTCGKCDHLSAYERGARQCPNCGNQVQSHVLICPKCSVDLATTDGSRLGHAARFQKTERKKCPECGGALKEGLPLCNWCGAEIATSTDDPEVETERRAEYGEGTTDDDEYTLAPLDGGRSPDSLRQRLRESSTGGDSSPTAKRPCPACNAPIGRDAVLCVKCGFDLRKGKFHAAKGAGAVNTLAAHGQSFEELEHYEQSVFELFGSNLRHFLLMVGTGILLTAVCAVIRLPAIFVLGGLALLIFAPVFFATSFLKVLRHGLFGVAGTTPKKTLKAFVRNVSRGSVEEDLDAFKTAFACLTPLAQQNLGPTPNKFMKRWLNLAEQAGFKAAGKIGSFSVSDLGHRMCAVSFGWKGTRDPRPEVIELDLTWEVISHEQKWYIANLPMPVRAQDEQSACGEICTNCEAPIPTDADVCNQCGNQVIVSAEAVSHRDVCPRCMADLPDGSGVCEHCGDQISTSETPSSAAASDAASARAETETSSSRSAKGTIVAVVIGAILVSVSLCIWIWLHGNKGITACLIFSGVFMLPTALPVFAAFGHRWPRAIVEFFVQTIIAGTIATIFGGLLGSSAAGQSAGGAYLANKNGTDGTSSRKRARARWISPLFAWIGISAVCSLLFAFLAHFESRRGMAKQTVNPTTSTTQSSPVDEPRIYRDQIHGFFEVALADGMAGQPDIENTTMQLPDGVPHGGETVKASRAEFRLDENSEIRVVAHRTYQDDVDEQLMEDHLANLRENIAGVTVDEKRLTTIDGVEAMEFLYAFEGLREHTVRYRKNGLDHRISLTCAPNQYDAFKPAFSAFLKNYRSLSEVDDVANKVNDSNLEQDIEAKHEAMGDSALAAEQVEDVWEIAGTAEGNGEIASLEGQNSPVINGSLLAGGKIAICSGSGEVHLWAFTQGPAISKTDFVTTTHKGLLASTPDGSKFVTCQVADEEVSLCIWEVSSQQQLHRFDVVVPAAPAPTANEQDLDTDLNIVEDAAFSSTGQRVAAKLADGTLLAWNVDTGDQILGQFDDLGAEDLVAGAEFVRLDDSILGLREGGFFRPRKAFAALSLDARTGVASDNVKLEYVATSTGAGFHVPGKTSRIKRVVLAGDRRLLCTTDEGHVLLLDPATGLEIAALGRPKAGVTDLRVSVSANGRYALTVPVNGIAQLWNLSELAADYPRNTALLVAADGSFLGVRFWRDGRRVILAESRGGELNLTLRVWDIPTASELRRMRAAGSQVGFSSNTALVLSATENAMHVWDLGKAREAHRLEASGLADERENMFESIAISPDGKFAIDAPSLRLWDVTGRELVGELAGHQGAVRCVAFSPGSRHALSGGEDNTVRLWNLSDCSEAKQFSCQGDVTCVAVSPDVSMAWAGVKTDNGSVLASWQIESGEPRRELDMGTGLIKSLAVSADGRRVLSADDEGDLSLWNVATSEKMASYHWSLPGKFQDADISPDGKLAVAAFGRRVLLWSLTEEDTSLDEAPSPQNLFCQLKSDATLSESPQQVWCRNGKISSERIGMFSYMPAWGIHLVAPSPDGRCLLVGGDRLVLLDLETGEELKESAPCAAGAPAFFGDSARAVSFNGTEGRLWDLDTMKIIQEFEFDLDMRRANRIGGRFTCLAYNADGQMAVTGSDDGQVVFWDIAAFLNPPKPTRGRPQPRIRLMEGTTGSGNILSVAVSPSGDLVAAVCPNRTMRVWETKTGRKLDLLKEGMANAGLVAVSPDGKSILASTLDQLLRVWNTEGAETARIDLHPASVSAAAISAQENLALFGVYDVYDHSVRLWDLNKKEEIARFEGHTAAVMQLLFSPDGRLGISVGDDDTVRAWNLRATD